jgi:hypothetical protein
MAVTTVPLQILDSKSNARVLEGNKALVVGLTDRSGNPANIDIATSTLQVIDFNKAAIHRGFSYHLAGYDLAVPADDTIEFVTTTPDTDVRFHIWFSFASTQGCTLDIYEDCADLVGGTAFAGVNNDRNSANTSDLVIVRDPTSITEGAIIGQHLSGGTKVAGQSEISYELVLKQNSIYLWRFTSLANGNDIYFVGSWNEYVHGEL